METIGHGGLYIGLISKVWLLSCRLSEDSIIRLRRRIPSTLSSSRSLLTPMRHRQGKHFGGRSTAHTLFLQRRVIYSRNSKSPLPPQVELHRKRLKMWLCPYWSDPIMQTIWTRSKSVYKSLVISKLVNHSLSYNWPVVAIKLPKKLKHSSKIVTQVSSRFLTRNSLNGNNSKTNCILTQQLSMKQCTYISQAVANTWLNSYKYMLISLTIGCPIVSKGKYS